MSDLGFRVEAARLPLSDDLRRLFSNDAALLALAGGEDYELALVAPPAVIEALRPRLDQTLTEVGVAVAGAPTVTVVDASGSAIEVGDGGWDHFRVP
jgi:thiamine-monophosphate kinase